MVSALFSGGLLLALYFLTLNWIYSPAGVFDLIGAGQRLWAAVSRVNPLSPEIMLLFWMAVVWRRAVASLSPSLLEPGKTGLRFRLGVLAYAVIAILAGPRSLTPGLLPLFFFSSLVAISLARVESISQVRGAGKTPFGWQWLASLVSLFFLTVALGLGFGAIMGSRLATAVFSGIQLLFVGLIRLVSLLISPIWILTAPILNRLFEALQALFAQDPPSLPPQLEEPFFLGQFDGPPSFLETVNSWIASLEPIWPFVRTGLILSLVVALVLYALRRRVQGHTHGPRSIALDDQGKTLGGGQSLRTVPARIATWLADLPPLGEVLASKRLRTAIVARRVYANLLNLAAKRGRPRERWETPLEFETTLRALFPGMEREIQVITSTYLQVRYGELPETRDSASEVEEAWLRIRGEVHA